MHRLGFLEEIKNRTFVDEPIPVENFNPDFLQTSFAQRGLEGLNLPVYPVLDPSHQRIMVFPSMERQNDFLVNFSVLDSYSCSGMEENERFDDCLGD